MIVNQVVKILKDSNFKLNERKELIKRFKKISNYETKNDVLRLLGIVCGKAFVGPAYFHLDISNSCNLSCSYCWFHSKTAADKYYSENWKKQKIKLKRFKELVDDLYELNTELIFFSGAGEPLTHPDVIEMAEYVKSKGIHLQLFTNAVLLNNEYSKMLVDMSLDEIYCSISASNSKTYEKLHPSSDKKNFRKIQENISFLSSYKKQKSKSLPRIIVIEVINKLNYKGALEMIKWANEVGANDVRFQLMHNIKMKNIMLNEKEKIEFNKILKKVKEKSKDYNINIQNNISIQMNSFDSKSGNWEADFYKDKGCFTGWYFSRYWVSDGISFCCAHKIVDSLKNKRFKDIWLSERYNKMRVIARDSNTRENFVMRDANLLLDKECEHGGNYEINREIYEKLKKYDLLNFIR
jgi:MoaA/NifB/PqqE/SkfB family radical SAM enzyme